jgi:hypothetical protein
MDLRLLTIALAFYFLPFSNSFAQNSKRSFKRSDFSHAQETVKNGRSLIQFNLSEEGKNKVKTFNKTEINKNITLDINGKVHDFTLRQAITGDKIEVGPFNHVEAKKIVEDVNTK